MGTSQTFQDKIIETNGKNNQVAISISELSGVPQLSNSQPILEEPELDDSNQTIEINSESPSQLSCKSEMTRVGIPDPSQNQGQNVQDTLSLASASSSASLNSASSGSSTTINMDPGSREQFSSKGSVPIKVFSPANENEDIHMQGSSQPHHRIRRVPSTANPKHRVPSLGRTQRSKSQPHLNIPTIQSQRRNSSPSPLCFQGPIPNIHGASGSGKQQAQNLSTISHILQQQLQQSHLQPNIHAVQPQLQHQHSRHGTQQQQQQVIYLQIPQPPQSQAYDPQALQHQISSQLQQLVPQIYSLLLNQITSPTLSSTSSNKSSSNQGSHKSSDPIQPSFNNSEVQSQRVINQILEQNSNASNKAPSRQKSQVNQSKRQKSNSAGGKASNVQKATSVENINETTEDISKYLQLESLSQILQQIPAHILQQNQNSSNTSYIEIQQNPGCPKISIPITPELLSQCQQYQQQHRDVEYVPYHPSLETILEESLSVKHLNINSYPTTKIIACILTVLCVVVVVLLAGNKTIAVVVVAVIFIIFLLASIFYLYVNSTKNNNMRSPLSQSNSQRIQISGGLTSCDKGSLPV